MPLSGAVVIVACRPHAKSAHADNIAAKRIRTPPDYTRYGPPLMGEGPSTVTTLAKPASATQLLLP